MSLEPPTTSSGEVNGYGILETALGAACGRSEAESVDSAQRRERRLTALGNSGAGGGDPVEKTPIGLISGRKLVVNVQKSRFHGQKCAIIEDCIHNN